MEKLNLWETSLQKKYIFFNTIEEYIKYIQENNIKLSFTVKEEFNPEKDKSNNTCDDIANNNKVILRYTDESHPIAVSNNKMFQTIINPTFFNSHKKEFTELALNYFHKQIQTEDTINIPDYIISDDLIQKIINDENLKDKFYIVTDCTNQKLTEYQMKLIKENHIKFKHIINRETVFENENKIGNYSIKELENIKEMNLKIYDIENLITYIDYVNPSTKITITMTNDEIESAKEIQKLFNFLSTTSNTYNITIAINNRETFKDIIKNKPANINLTIQNDLYDYSYDEYINEEKQLDSLIEHIKNNDTLSPFEKYIAVYNIVKNFKTYNENEENKDDARYLRYILNNEYMVCVGYAKLLETLLDKVGIPCKEISVNVDTSYDDGFTMEEINTTTAGHARNIIKIDDDKYDIHGIYLADPTWDNDSEKDTYFNAILTFDKKKEADRLELLKETDLLFDFHNEEEFDKKIEYYLKYKINKNNSKKENDKLIESCCEIFTEICNFLKKLDYQEYKILFNKYKDIIKLTNKNFEEVKKAFLEFLNEYKTYIIPKSNNYIDASTIILAAANSKKELENLTEEQFVEELSKLITIYQKYEEKRFPYIYDPNNPTEAYLESKHK